MGGELHIGVACDIDRKSLSEVRRPDSRPLKLRGIEVLESDLLTPEEVSKRYRDEISVGTLRNWRGMRIGLSFVRIRKAILHPIESLDAWHRTNFVTRRAPKGGTGNANDDAG